VFLAHSLFNRMFPTISHNSKIALRINYVRICFYDIYVRFFCFNMYFLGTTSSYHHCMYVTHERLSCIAAFKITRNTSICISKPLITVTTLFNMLNTHVHLYTHKTESTNKRKFYHLAIYNCIDFSLIIGNNFQLRIKVVCDHLDRSELSRAQAYPPIPHAIAHGV
jgi:hypothetical protein